MDAGIVTVLDICFCNPTHHRRGAGTQLVQWGVKRADEMGVHAFVDASLTGRRLYEQNGFRVTEHIRLKDETWPDRPLIEYLFMYRPAMDNDKMGRCQNSRDEEGGSML